jgi:hypothetical protein
MHFFKILPRCNPMRFVDGLESTKELRQRVMEETPLEPTLYADPAHVMSLPFPSLNNVPRRFNMSIPATTFSFMGRERFAEVWKTFSIINDNPLHRRAMYIYGSMGYGKSHILAALVCLLIRSGERVVYVPDCAEAIKDSFEYMRTAFLLAFCDSPSRLEEIAAWNCLNDITKFCRDLRWAKVRLWFVIDQANALDQQEDGRDNYNRSRMELDDFLSGVSVNHFEIYSASANVNSYKHTMKKQTNLLTIILLGGMTKV